MHMSASSCVHAVSGAYMTQPDRQHIDEIAERQLGLAQTSPIVESALAKIERVLPLAIRTRVQALQDTVTLNLPTPLKTEVGKFILSLSNAASQTRQVWLRYQSKKNEVSERLFDCYGLLYHKERWYTPGYCHLRQDTRIFRLDRVLTIELREESDRRTASGQFPDSN